MTARLCLGCSAPIMRGSRCQPCTEKRTKPRDWSAYNRRNKEKRGSSAHQRQLKQEVIARDGPHCQRCGRQDRVELDHVIPLDITGPAGDVPANGQILCHDCHKAKTRREQEMRKR